MKNIKQFIIDNCFSSGKSIRLNNRTCIETWWKNKGFLLEYYELLNKTQWLGNVSISERIHCIINDIDVLQNCHNCKNTTKFKSFKDGYYTYCSITCSTSCPDRNKKISENNNYSLISEKVKATCLERYGVDSFFKTKESTQKIAKTKTERYGNPSYNNNEKNKQTCISKYGVDKFDKLKTQHVDFSDVYDLHFIQKMTCVDIADKFGVSFTYITKLIHSNGFTPLKYSVSSHERKISEWLSSLGISYESSNRTILGRKELDLYISDSKLAIEINGLYWHSYSCKETKEEIFRHHTKRQMCVDKGIKLIQFTDKELIDKQDICKSIIYNNIGRYDTKIRASDCEIYYPTNTEYKNFLEENHIQGHINTSERLSLRYRGEIVAMMSVGKSRFQPNKKELLRFCIKKYTKVYGAGSKLFNNLKEDGMISYCSLDYFDGKLYEQLGFTHSHDSPPGYFYVKNGNTILSRHNAQKSKLCKLLITYSEELTEYDNMFNNGYTRYWNCGNSVWIYNNKGN